MDSKKIFPCGALVVGSLIILIGIGFTVAYVLEAIVVRLGEPDQSLLFWSLPILFMGLTGIVIGSGIGVWGVIRLRKIQQQGTSSDN